MTTDTRPHVMPIMVSKDRMRLRSNACQPCRTNSLSIMEGFLPKRRPCTGPTWCYASVNLDVPGAGAHFHQTAACTHLAVHGMAGEGAGHGYWTVKRDLPRTGGRVQIKCR